MGVTLAELHERMTHREWIEQMTYDKLKREAEDHAAVIRGMRSDHAALVSKLRRR